jgi:chemotaxis family two-component system sensor kinase Cph1
MPIVSADKTQMIQLFQNLIGNAIKYRGERAPRVHIASEREEQQWVIKIRDNGIGFDPADTSRIFEIFQRLYTDESQYTGTGIGLAICKRIVERHQGKIWAESILGEGSTFIFTFPVESAAKSPRK